MCQALLARPSARHLACACALMRLRGRLMGFGAGDESALSPFSRLPGDSPLAQRKQALTLAFAVNRPSNEVSL